MPDMKETVNPPQGNAPLCEGCEDHPRVQGQKLCSYCIYDEKHGTDTSGGKAKRAAKLELQKKQAEIEAAQGKK